MQNYLLAGEVVLAAFAQNVAFEHHVYIDRTGRNGGTQNLVKTFSTVLNVKDVLSDAHTTFLVSDQENLAKVRANNTQLHDYVPSHPNYS